MKNHLLYFVIVILALMITVKNPAQAQISDSLSNRFARDSYSLTSTWVGTDALGRTMPTHKDVGPIRKDHRRVVGIFYITWHRDKLHDLESPYMANVTKILHKDPSARLNTENPLWKYHSYHWAEPEWGYFLSKDKYVIRKDMTMLSDAGVDVIILDVTNAVRYWDEWHTIFKVMEKMKAEGNNVPKFCFWAFNGPVISVVQDLYENIYKKNKYKGLWFKWKGKPLLLYNSHPSVDATGGKAKNPNPHYDPKAKTDPDNPHYQDPYYTQKYYTDYTKEVKKIFTLRNMWWGYYKWHGKRFVGTEDNWSFGYDLGKENVKNMDPDSLVSTHNGKAEEAAVTPAQHASSLIGKSWTRAKGEPKLNKYDLPDSAYVPWLGKKVAHPQGYGIYFQQRWDEALKADPPFIYLNDWNEWTAGKYSPKDGKTRPFMRRKSRYFFVDQYNTEFNRGIQPMKGGYTDNYYMQMAENIRRYKGARAIPEVKGFTNIKIDGSFTDWKNTTVKYLDTKRDTYHRDYNGYGGLHYTNTSGRNDIVKAKIAVDRKNIYFFANTGEDITSHHGKNWMMLLIDADQNHKTGWNGYDYIINKEGVKKKRTTLMKYKPTASGGAWIKKAPLSYRYKGKKIEIAVPRELLALDDKKVFTFDFHWTDNPADLDTSISLCVNGDSAPNRRFNYRCIWRK